MAITSTENTSIHNLCVSMFNAAPDATNLALVVGYFEANGNSITALASALGENVNFTNLYSGTVAENVTLMLANFGLTSADTVANDYFTTQLTAGVDKATLLLAANNYLLNTDAATLATNGLTDAAAVLANKTTVAEYYSASAAAPTTFAELQATIASVDSTAASVTTATDAIDESLVTEGTAFTLTDDDATGVTPDTIIGTSGQDTITSAAVL